MWGCPMIKTPLILEYRAKGVLSALLPMMSVIPAEPQRAMTTFYPHLR